MQWIAKTDNHAAYGSTEREALDRLLDVYRSLEDARFNIMEDFIYCYGVKVMESPDKERALRQNGGEKEEGLDHFTFEMPPLDLPR